MQLLLAVSLLPPSAFHCWCSPVILGIDVSLQPMSHGESLFTSTASAAAITTGVQGAQPPRCHAAAHPLASPCHHLQCDLALLEAAWVGGLWMLEVKFLLKSHQDGHCSGSGLGRNHKEVDAAFPISPITPSCSAPPTVPCRSVARNLTPHSSPEWPQVGSQFPVPLRKLRRPKLLLKRQTHNNEQCKESTQGCGYRLS